MKKVSLPNKETALKTLIILGIIAICVSLYIQYGKPYIKELSLEKQDQVRIKDLDTLDGIIKEIASSSATQTMGKENIIYISIPSDDPNCSNLELPSTPDSWSYHCSNLSDYKKTDGSGWIPINFKGKISQLPVDSINNLKTLNYYSYVTNSTNEHVLTSGLSSTKHLIEKAQTDKGIDDIRYETRVNNN
ncbi:MAG: hypothetical protein KBB62_02420, partial [Candidatus Pacebacteria bacterium]|nr:hypothetical protein [Candidatus Paceibacterota bacterium]